MVKRILVPVDGSEAGQRGLQEAIGLAAATRARLVLLHVVVDLPWPVEVLAGVDRLHLYREMLERGRRVLADGRRQVARHGVAIEAVLREPVNADAAAAIAAEAKAQGCDLIVMGTRRHRGVRRSALGSDAAAVVSASHVPVLLARFERERWESRLTQVKAHEACCALACAVMHSTQPFA